MTEDVETGRTASCGFQHLLSTASFKISEFHCAGRPRVTSVEAAQHPEIVFPQRGAYIRRDEAGSVYLDETVIGFFEARRPYTVEHLEPRPDVTTVIMMLPSARIADILFQRPRHSFLFDRSAVRASPETHLAHKAFLRHVRRHDFCVLAAEEAAVDLITRSVEQSLSAADLNLTDIPCQRFTNDIIISVVEFIRNNFKRRLSLDEIAEYSGYSVFHLCRVFRQRMKVSIHKYVMQLRLQASHQALLETSDSITAIALDHGFSSHAHFSTQFSRWAGFPPSEARQSWSAVNQ